MNHPAPRIRTGIGGWVFVPWRAAFYPSGLKQADELAYAASQLAAIEINATFYRTQSPASWAKWRAAVPDDFRFAIKGSRYVVTRPNLAEAGDGIAQFVGQGMEALGEVLGPILWDLPDPKRFNADEIAAFAALLPATLANRPLRHAIAARHDSFADPRFAEILAARGIAIVGHDEDAVPATAGFAYRRLTHGDAAHDAAFPPDQLDRIAKLVATEAAGREAFVFVINGGKPRAPFAARALQARLIHETAT